MNNKLSDKDKKDWESFLSSKEKIKDKEKFIKNRLIKNKITKIIDLHGYSLADANKFVERYIEKSFEMNVDRIIVVTGKGLRSTNIENPYVSEDLGILKHSVPEFIRSNKKLMSIIQNISEASIEDGGSGAFNIFLKKIKE